jgi:hypothetical protein
MKRIYVIMAFMFVAAVIVSLWVSVNDIRLIKNTASESGGTVIVDNAN